MASSQDGVLLLSKLDPMKRRATTCARVSRMWDFYTREGRLAHVDLVLIDEQGNKMYAEVGANHEKQFKKLVQEGNVYLMQDFFIQPSKARFRAVEGQFMMKVTPWTTFKPKTDVPSTFPRYAYSLTNFNVLPSLVGAQESFIDAMGIITGISDILHIRLPGKPTASLKRTLHLVDIDGASMDAALWGDQATTFDADGLYKTAQSEVIIILLVGTLMKNYRGRDIISCGEAGKYYINPDIPEKTTYCERLANQLPFVQWLKEKDDQYYNLFEQSNPEEVDIKYLLSTNPNEYLGKRMICTVTVMRLHSTTWWFMSCLKCHRTAYAMQDTFRCSDANCAHTKAEPSDGTGEVEFVFFSLVAEQIVQKKAFVLAEAAA